MAGDEGGGGPGGGGDPRPGEGYAIEIAAVRKILRPLEESVVAAHKIKDDWKSLSSGITTAAVFDIEQPAKDMLEEWGFGMGRVAEHTDVIVDTLRQVIAAYMMADLLRVKDFAPTEDNIAKLPFGEHGLRAWKDGDRPTFDPPPEIYQEPWLDDDGGSSVGDGGGADGDGTTVTGDLPANPRYRVAGEGGAGWVVDGGRKGSVA
ncbi:hypothetical protein DTL70_19870 [Streptomyces diacarni]|uniref:Uncharacterized protein n=1 Tax=Streptomyces diacarni TaxID=2800381 RepID=A0A367ETS5_9ACTN|nr:hypothetical protein [Streptomyces diacarni]RCG20570.1 hypothetical protein DTL70_19870 [Streptomyces diacarni]